MRSHRFLAAFLALSFSVAQYPVFAADSMQSAAAESEAAHVNPIEKPFQLDSLIVSAQTNYQHGRYKDAIQLFEQAQKFPGEKTSYQEAQISLGLAEAYRSSGRYKEAEALFKSAIAQAEESDKGHLNKKYKAGKKRASDLIPAMMSDLSVLYLDQSRFPECEQILNSSIAIALKKVGPKNINLALPYNGMTRLYIKWGKLSDAKEMNDKTMALFTTPASRENWLYAYTAFNLAQILNEKGKYKEAEALYKATLLGIQSLVGFEHEYVAIAQEPLGELYRKEGRFAEARKAFQNVRKIRAATLTKEHPEYGKVLLDLALLARDEGRYVKAQELCQQATKVIERALGKENVEISKCWITQASIARYQGRYSEAEELARKALQLDEKLLTADHPSIAHDEVELANILADERKFDESESLLNKALKISKEKLGADHPDIALTVHSLADVYFAQKNYAKAETMFRDALALAQKTLGSDNVQTINDQRSLCDVLVAQKKYDEAEPLSKSILSADEKLFGKKSPQVAGDLESLATLYRKQNKNDLAEPLLKQSREITAALPGGSAVQSYTSATLSGTSNDKSVSDKWALLIGISNFKDSTINLKYAAKDATDFKNFLVGQENFASDHVKLLTDANATKEEIISKLGDGWLGKHAKENDLVVVYVSSHGSSSQEDVGVNFLVAHDTDKMKLVSTGLPMQWLTKIIQEQVHSKRVVVILDVCHSGSAGDENKKAADDIDDDDDTGAGDSSSKGLLRTAKLDAGGLKVGSGQVILCSSLADQVSWESKNYPNSVFTRRLIESLQCNGKGTTLNQAFNQLKTSVGAEVLSDRGMVQTPDLFNKAWTGGDPVLAVPVGKK
ncbi:MAG: tetratricopeptide repeat protein [Candidatus Melainabacteria bacterium]|nr:MAG: tetratricopeptide repeat protein [Candidatus Melainabacteria bacterium]